MNKRKYKRLRKWRLKARKLDVLQSHLASRKMWVPYLPMLAEEALEVSSTGAGGQPTDPQVPS